MISEELEFQISQYADGTLPAAERAALEVRLAEDAEARRMVAQYRRLGEHLSRDLGPLPNVKWDRLAAHLSSAIAAEDALAVIGRIGSASGAATWTWRSRFAIAAGVLVALGTGLLVYNGHGGNPAPAPVEPTAVASVSGPQAEPAAGPAVQEIKIGPSPALAKSADSWRYAEGVVQRPSSAVIAGEMKPPHEGESFIH
ncbi:MAG TPA: hypothetical protein VLI90_17495 [Tepidisphaeraceae bacterium]|nr:hypothetical protein [Tepidisphaeraceae bacterium]